MDVFTAAGVSIMSDADRAFQTGSEKLKSELFFGDINSMKI